MSSWLILFSNCHKNMDVSLTHYLLGNRAACEQCPGGAHRQWLQQASLQYSVHRGKRCGAQKSEASSDLSLRGSRKEWLRTRPLADFLVIQSLRLCSSTAGELPLQVQSLVRELRSPLAWPKKKKKGTRPLEFKSWICGLLSELESKFLNPSLLILFVSQKVLAHRSHHCCKNSTSSYM